MPINFLLSSPPPPPRVTCMCGPFLSCTSPSVHPPFLTLQPLTPRLPRARSFSRGRVRAAPRERRGDAECSPECSRRRPRSPVTTKGRFAVPSSCDRLILEVDPFTIKLGALVSTGGETFGNMSPKKPTKKSAKKNAEKSRVTSSEISNTPYCMALLILITFCQQVVCFL